MEAFTLIAYALIIAVIFWAFKAVFGGQGKISQEGGMICPHCGTRGEPSRETRGSLGIEILLWICFIIPGLIYTLWRLTTRYDACPACKAGGMIPVQSPLGKKLMQDASN